MKTRTRTASLAGAALIGSCMLSPADAQTPALPAAITALRPGQVLLIATYINQNGKVVSDTLSLTVLPIAIATIDLINAFNPPRWVSTITVGKSFCALATARDSAGNLLTGRPMVFKSSDTTIARIVPNPICPDTSIDPSKMTTNPIPPGLETIRR